MKITLALVALLAFASTAALSIGSANAQVCNTFGTQTICSNGTTMNRFGGQTIIQPPPSSTTYRAPIVCNTFGTQTICN